MLATTVIQKERFDLIRQVRVTQSIESISLGRKIYK